jgi:hypothetical protein
MKDWASLRLVRIIYGLVRMPRYDLDGTGARTYVYCERLRKRPSKARLGHTEESIDPLRALSECIRPRLHMGT